MEKRFHCGHFLFEIYLNVDSWCKNRTKIEKICPYSEIFIIARTMFPL